MEKAADYSDGGRVMNVVLEEMIDDYKRGDGVTKEEVVIEMKEATLNMKNIQKRYIWLIIKRNDDQGYGGKD